MSTHTSLPIRTVTDPDVKATYAVDESVGATAPGDFEVVRARDLGDVVEVMRWAHETRTPVVPQGARSSLTGSSVAIEGGVVLNTEGLDAITTIDPLEGLAVLGPGVVNKDLKDAVAAAGPLLPARPRELGVLHHRRQRRHQRRRPVLREVRRHRRLRPRPPGGAPRRRGDPHRPPHRQGRGRPRPHRPVRRLRGHPRRGHRGHHPPRARARPRADRAGDLRLARRRRRVAIVALRRERHVPSLVELLDRAAVAAVQALADYGFPQDCEAVLLVQSDRPDHTARGRAAVCRAAHRRGRRRRRRGRRPGRGRPPAGRSAGAQPGPGGQGRRATSRTSACRSAGSPT